jgi:hypothetical protein
VLQHLQSIRPESKVFSKNLPHSWLWYIQFAASPTCWLPWTSLISLPNTINCFHIHTRLAWTLPLTDATCVHKFFIPLSDRIGGLEGPFQTFFWILAEQLSQISLNETPEHKMLFLVESPSYVRAVL